MCLRCLDACQGTVARFSREDSPISIWPRPPERRLRRSCGRAGLPRLNAAVRRLNGASRRAVRASPCSLFLRWRNSVARDRAVEPVHSDDESVRDAEMSPYESSTAVPTDHGPPGRQARALFEALTTGIRKSRRSAMRAAKASGAAAIRSRPRKARH
jgi:hypothetical protein